MIQVKLWQKCWPVKAKHLSSMNMGMCVWAMSASRGGFRIRHTRERQPNILANFPHENKEKLDRSANHPSQSASWDGIGGGLGAKYPCQIWRESEVPSCLSIVFILDKGGGGSVGVNCNWQILGKVKSKLSIWSFHFTGWVGYVNRPNTVTVLCRTASFSETTYRLLSSSWKTPCA